MKFLVFATDLLPTAGLPTSGTALRTYGFVEGLRSHGHEVEVAVPRAALEGLRGRGRRAPLGPEAEAELARLEENAFDYRNQRQILDRVRPDVVLCGHWPAATFDRRLAQPLVIDLAGPHLLERHYQGEPDRAAAVLGKLHAVSLADHVIVSGEKQRLYFLSFMLRADLPHADERTITVHMPLRPNPPERPAAEPSSENPRFVFGGVFLPWQDPSAALDQLALELASRRRGSLTLIGGVHAHYDLPKGVYEELFARLARFPFVRTLPLLPYQPFIDELGRADVALDLMRWNLERELAMTIRSTTYLWSGLPVIYNDFADLGLLIRSYDAGWTVPPSEPEALRQVVEQVFADPAAVRRKSRNATRLAREVFGWDRAVEPLLAALGAPPRRMRLEIDVAPRDLERVGLPVTRARPVQQRFLSRVDGLCRVECCLELPGERPVKPFGLSLYRLPDPGAGAETGELIARRSYEAEVIRHSAWVALDLDPVRDSAGRAFLLALESEASCLDESLRPWTFRGRPFPMLGVCHGDRPAPGLSLCLRTTSAHPVP